MNRRRGTRCIAGWAWLLAACAGESAPAAVSVGSGGGSDAAVSGNDAEVGAFDAAANAADGGDAASIAVGGAPRPLRNYVFVTSTTHDADFGAPSAADVFCNEAAAAADLPGEYVAWLSTTTVDAIDRLPEHVAGWARPDGLAFALSRDELVRGAILYPPRLDEQGRDVSDSRPTVFTGTSEDGTLYSGGRYDHCADWSEADASLLYRGGTPSGGPLLWTEGNGADCASRAAFYCLGTDDALDLEFAPRSGRLAFVSEGAWAPGGGIESADELCQAEADASRHPGMFKALLATSTASAADRFDDGATWVRPDGVAIVGKAIDLLHGRVLLAPIAQQADARYVSTVGVWSGASDVVTRGTAMTHCDDWTATSVSVSGNAGMAGYASEAFFDGQAGACDITYYHVYCLQQ